MARQLRWSRFQSLALTEAPGQNGSIFDLARASALPGETYTRIRFAVQLTYEQRSIHDSPLNKIAYFGIIDTPQSAVAPPGRPLTNPDLDWLWLEPVPFTAFSSDFTSAGAFATVVTTSAAPLRDVRAQRMADASQGSKLWFVLQWAPNIIADDVMIRHLWASVGILEP